MINEQLTEQLTSIVLRLPKIRKLILFGSRARGDAEDRSDLDLAIEAPELLPQDWHTFLTEIENLDTLLSIDIIRLEEAPKELKDTIFREGRILYERS